MIVKCSMCGKEGRVPEGDYYLDHGEELVCRSCKFRHHWGRSWHGSLFFSTGAVMLFVWLGWLPLWWVVAGPLVALACAALFVRIMLDR